MPQHSRIGVESQAYLTLCRADWQLVGQAMATPLLELESASGDNPVQDCTNLRPAAALALLARHSKSAWGRHRIQL